MKLIALPASLPGLTQPILVFALLCILALSSQALSQSEDDFNDSLCKTLQGRTEVRHPYTFGDGERGYVRVDCETDRYVIEGGLDKRSSLDSLQQALFFSVVTDKEPVIVIYDTDGKVGRYEHRIRQAADKARVTVLRLNFADTKNRELLNALR